MVHGHPAAQRQDADLPKRRHHLQYGLKAGLQAHHAHLRAVKRLGGVGHPPELTLFLSEGLHHPHTVQALIDQLHHVASRCWPSQLAGKTLLRMR